MADRIFINKDSGQYSERELNRIDWSQVRDGMLEARKAANAGKNLNPFGMVTGLLDTRLAQFRAEEDFAPAADAPAEPGDESRIQMIADAVSTGQDLEPEEAQFGLDNVEAVAAKAGMDPEEVASTLQDFASLNVGEAPAEDGLGAPEDGTDVDGTGVDEGMETFASRIAKKKLPAALEKFKFHKKDGDNPEKHKDKDEDKEDKEDKEDDEEGVEAMLRKGGERKAGRKIVFTDAAQLSAAAVEAARAAGDEELVRATLAARAERRVAIGRLAAAATLEQITREAKNKRRAVTAKVEKPKEVKANVKTDKTTTGDDFVKPTELSTGQKSAFASRARELGFPEKYIDALLGSRSASTVTEDEVRRIAEGPGSYKEKSERVASMIRQANLDEANRNRIYKFWVEELGYQPDYVKKMVEDYKA